MKNKKNKSKKNITKPITKKLQKRPLEYYRNLSENEKIKKKS